MGVFGWVDDKPRKELFEVTTYKNLVDGQAIADADFEKPGMHYTSKKKDVYGLATGVGYYVSKGSRGNDYLKAVRALKIARSNK